MVLLANPFPQYISRYALLQACVKWRFFIIFADLLLLQSIEATSLVPLSQMLHLFFPLHHLNGCPKHVGQSEHYWTLWSFFVKLFHVTHPSIHPSMDGIIQGRKPWHK